MEHIALWEGTGDGTPETTWAEPVTDQQYNGRRTRDHLVRRAVEALGMQLLPFKIAFTGLRTWEVT